MERGGFIVNMMNTSCAENPVTAKNEYYSKKLYVPYRMVLSRKAISKKGIMKFPTLCLNNTVGI